MPHREIGSELHEIFAVEEVDGAPRVDCPWHGGPVLFSECQSCEHCTVLRLKGAALPFVVCPTRDMQPHGLRPTERDVEVRRVMSRAVTVKGDLPVADVIRTLIDEGVGAATVVDGAGRTVGVVSKTDIVLEDHAWSELRDYTLSMWPASSPWDDTLENDDDVFIHDFLRTRTAADLMTRQVAYVSPDTPLSGAAEVMAKAHLHHVPVLDREEHPVGMVSALDLARWIGAHRA